MVGVLAGTQERPGAGYLTRPGRRVLSPALSSALGGVTAPT